MFKPRLFFKGFIIGSLTLGGLFLAANVLLSRVGEIGLNSIINRQLSSKDENILFSSGINQYVFFYKLKLLDKINPKIIAIGSSRAYQVREQFFNQKFVNLGGTVHNLGDLEYLASQFNKSQKLKLALLFIDPWWFNQDYNYLSNSLSSSYGFPEKISTSLAIHAVGWLRKGNWISAAARSKNLGLHAILSGAGYRRDGSYDYVDTMSGKAHFDDTQFSDTLTRIRESRDRFQKNDDADSYLVERACSAIIKIKRSIPNLVVIAPPFAGLVWEKMNEGGYTYIAKTNAMLANCLKDIDFYDLYSVKQISGSTDCEFIDGFHGGDVTYARILKYISGKNMTVKNSLANQFIDEFIQNNAGYAAGIIRNKFPTVKEIDFLQIGCAK
jgi:hypothetical protein